MRWAAQVGNLSGWRRNLAALIFGMMATLAMPPLFLFPLLIASFTGLYWLISAASPKRAFLDGWWWGWGYYISGLYWMCIALMTDPDKFAWMIPFALFGLTAVIAIYCGVACWIYKRLVIPSLSRDLCKDPSTTLRSAQGENILTNIFTFATVWTLVEFARGHLFTGFPWNLAGYSFAVSDAAIQLASLAGAYGLTWWAVWLAAVPASGNRRAIALSYIMCALLIGWGQWRLNGANHDTVPGVTLRLVQANILQHHKWDPKLQIEGLREYIRLTRAPGIEKVTHVIWPETAIPYVVKQGTFLTRALGSALPPGGLLISGGLREEREGDRWELWNSLMAFDRKGTIVGRYDKYKLVPFGEFVPFREWLPDALLTPVGMKDFSRGQGPQTLDWPGLVPVSPLICYEAIFPELAVAADRRPELLLNVTNDAWFGMSSGPHQHFHMARLRAVEQAVPLVRVANTGISGVIDSYGHVLSRIELGKKAILDVSLPKTSDKPFYARYGNNFLWLLGLINLIILARRNIHKQFIKFLLQVVAVRK